MYTIYNLKYMYVFILTLIFITYIGIRFHLTSVLLTKLCGNLKLKLKICYR